jgi:excisionase family DNA binding protein
MAKKSRKKPLVPPTAFDRQPFTYRQLMQWLSCSRRFVEYEVKEGRLRKIVIGNRLIRFLPDDVDAWLKRRGSFKPDEQA